MSKREYLRSSIEKNFEHLNPKLDHALWGNPMTPYGATPPKVLSPDAFGKELVQFINTNVEANVSPFYAYLASGKLSLAGVQEWCRQFYFDLRQFPITIAQIVANSYYQYDIRQVYGLNLVEELGELMPTKEHPILFLRTCRALGLKDEEMEFVNPIPEILIPIEYRLKLMKELNVVEAIAAGSLAFEGTLIQRYKMISKMLKDCYGLKDEDLEFFYVHTGGEMHEGYGGDANHIAEGLNFIKKYATTAETQERVRQALWRSVEARKVTHWGLFRHIVMKEQPFYTEFLDSVRQETKKKKSA